MMKKLLALMALIFIGAVGWRVGEGMSSDAVSMAVGLLLGVMAGVPTALLVLASDRRQRNDDGYHRRTRHAPLPPPPVYQPPVIVMTGQQGHTLPSQQTHYPALPDHDAWPVQRPPAREFRILGEQADEW